METKQVRFFLSIDMYTYLKYFPFAKCRFVCSELAKKEGVELIEKNDELFWAVMGGSPGNFGILTHVTFRPLHDKDYPDSRMMKFTTPYTTKKHRKLEALMAEMNDNVDLPKNYDLMYTIMGKRVPVTSGPKFFELIEEVGGGTPHN